MKKFWYQNLLQYTIWFFAGILFLGAILDTISNTISLVDERITNIGSVIILLLYTLTQILLRYRHLYWITNDGQKVAITKLGVKSHILTLALFALLWLPRLLNFNSDYCISRPMEGIVNVTSEYQVIDREILGKYFYCLWEIKEESGVSTSAMTIGLIDQPKVIVREIWSHYLSLDAISGKDVTGEKNPDLVINAYSGGVHCCHATYILDLGLSKLTDYSIGETGNCKGEFRNLDGDKSLEFITCDDNLTYEFCSYVETPMPIVVMKFDGFKFSPHTSSFEHLPEVKNKLQADLSRAEKDPTLCNVMQVSLNHLYLGHIKEAQDEFIRLYKMSDRDFRWNQLLYSVRGRPLVESISVKHINNLNISVAP